MTMVTLLSPPGSELTTYEGGAAAGCRLGIDKDGAQRHQLVGRDLSVRADLSRVIAVYGPGVYSVLVWGRIGGEAAVLSEYSIFHGIDPPGAYAQYR